MLYPESDGTLLVDQEVQIEQIMLVPNGGKTG